jgi:hypothetical protein
MFDERRQGIANREKRGKNKESYWLEYYYNGEMKKRNDIQMMARIVI